MVKKAAHYVFKEARRSQYCLKHGWRFIYLKAGLWPLATLPVTLFNSVYAILMVYLYIKYKFHNVTSNVFNKYSMLLCLLIFEVLRVH